jgi:hypothetical protein
VKFDDALITKITTKPNSLGATVAQLVVEIESENPLVDFAPLLNLQRVHVALQIEGSMVRNADV